MLEVRIKKRLPSFDLDVGFSMDRGILSIMGPSGSGKTLTLQCIAGLVRPDEGYIRLNGRVLFDSSTRINLPARLRRAGFVFQNYALFTHLNVRENIAYGIRGALRQDKDERVSGLLARMKIERLGDRYPRQLSSGEQQRVALARALASEPDVLLLDEPFSALDILNKEGLELDLLSLQRSFGGSTLFVTHDSSQGYSLGSRIAIYESGHIIQCDARNRVISSPANRTVARLMGLRNLLPGRISTLNNSEVSIAILGLGCELKGLLNKEMQLAVGQSVTVGIQPERVSVMERSAENALPGVVDHVVEGIGGVNYFFRTLAEETHGRYLLASSPRPGAPSVCEGRSCYLYFPPESVVLIPDASPFAAVDDIAFSDRSVDIGEEAPKTLGRKVGAFVFQG